MLYSYASGMESTTMRFDAVLNAMKSRVMNSAVEINMKKNDYTESIGRIWNNNNKKRKKRFNVPTQSNGFADYYFIVDCFAVILSMLSKSTLVC